MKISFGSIVFNIIDTLPDGMFEKCVANVHDIAHEIIIVEGATNGGDGDTSGMTPDGRSTDGTVEYLRDLQKKYDKIKIVESKGFWRGKTEMCNAYSAIASGGYIWQLDSDEFYQKEDMKKIVALLEKYEPDAVHFYAYHFFGGYDKCIYPGQGRWANLIPWMRIFKHVQGQSFWKTHEPPEYYTCGSRCNSGRVITREETARHNVFLYHYSCVDIKQIEFKEKFFGNRLYRSCWNEMQGKEKGKVFGDIVLPFTGKHPCNIMQN